MLRTSILFAVLAASLAGCRDECDPATDAPSCDGNVAVTCPEPGVDQLVPIRWSHRDCGEKVCVMAGGSAFCALSGEPNAACGDQESACENPESRIYCTQGYVTWRGECRTCSADDAGYPICEGGASWKCTSDADCVSSLHCNSYGYCVGGDGGS